MNVLIIPEDFRTDQYILKPLVRRMFNEIGKSNANVRMCLDPVMGGVDRATNWNELSEVLKMHPMVHVFLLLVDRDGNAGRREQLDRLEKLAAELLSPNRILIAENAWQEIEVWGLAGQELPKDWSWKDVRSEPHPKETYFEPLAKERKWEKEPGAGRTSMGREAAANYSRVKSRCPEDIGRLETRLSDWLSRV